MKEIGIQTLSHFERRQTSNVVIYGKTMRFPAYIRGSMTCAEQSGQETLMDFCDLWIRLNWSRIITKISRLQNRIAKATIKGFRNLAKRLQHLLQNSFYAKLLAIKKVTENKGKNTAGIDGKLWKTGFDKIKAVFSLKSKKYKASPLKRVYIEKKKKTKKRPLGIPTMKDRAMQALFAFLFSALGHPNPKLDHKAFVAHHPFSK
jgi:hypothetical protein